MHKPRDDWGLGDLADLFSGEFGPGVFGFRMGGAKHRHRRRGPMFESGEVKFVILRLLKEKPSHYMQKMYYSTQPMEIPDDKSVMQATFKMINAETQLVWASDYPPWDLRRPFTLHQLAVLEPRHPRQLIGQHDALEVRIVFQQRQHGLDVGGSHQLGRGMAGSVANRLGPGGSGRNHVRPGWPR